MAQFQISAGRVCAALYGQQTDLWIWRDDGYFEMADANMQYVPQVGCCFSSEPPPSSEDCPLDSGSALF